MIGFVKRWWWRRQIRKRGMGTNYKALFKMLKRHSKNNLIRMIIASQKEVEVLKHQKGKRHAHNGH